LQLDGEVQANLHGARIIIGEQGRVIGTVSAENVVIRGYVEGVVKALDVTLESGAHVEGEIHHRTLAIDAGAYFDGRVRRPQDESELKPMLDATQHPDHAGGGHN
jgi:cytoskeletal protein CcmA (bactofilin family)